MPQSQQGPLRAEAIVSLCLRAESWIEQHPCLVGLREKLVQVTVIVRSAVLMLSDDPWKVLGRKEEDG